MCMSGTEVAKESSDIIILDDDFASVVKVSVFYLFWKRSLLRRMVVLSNHDGSFFYRMYMVIGMDQVMNVPEMRY